MSTRTRAGARTPTGAHSSSISPAHEVRNFLLANALYWIKEFHADGLRVDAVASMLYLDYSRAAGEWVPNEYGGRENLEAVTFLRELNEVVHGREPGVIVMAEESTAWPGVSRPTTSGGLGFTFKWNMGWMHDTLAYFQREPVHRRFHHDELTFSLVYAWDENFVLPLSHDEVVHGKRSLLGRMPGDRWQKLANLRALYGYLWAHPGKQLLFMGCELAQQAEWSEEAGSLDWHLLDDPDHAGVRALVRDLNSALSSEPALWQRTTRPTGSPGSRAARATRTCSPSRASRPGASACSSASAISLPALATPAACRCRWLGPGRRCSTRTPASTPGRTSATSVRSKPRRRRSRLGLIRRGGAAAARDRVAGSGRPPSS